MMPVMLVISPIINLCMFVFTLSQVGIATIVTG